MREERGGRHTDDHRGIVTSDKLVLPLKRGWRRQRCSDALAGSAAAADDGVRVAVGVVATGESLRSRPPNRPLNHPPNRSIPHRLARPAALDLPRVRPHPRPTVLCRWTFGRVCYLQVLLLSLGWLQ